MAGADRAAEWRMLAARALGALISRDIRRAAGFVAAAKDGAGRPLEDSLEGAFDPISDFRCYERCRSSADASLLEHGVACRCTASGCRLPSAAAGSHSRGHCHHAGIDLAAPIGTPA